MASNISSVDLISERYGYALYDLAAENKCIDDIINNFDSVDKVLKESSDLKRVIQSPLVNSEVKLNILLTIFSKNNLHKLTTTFLKVLDKNKRISNLSSIILQFKKITNQLKNSLGQKLSLNFDVDKNIIGGLIVKVGSKMIDTSIANKINKLKIAIKGA